MTDQDFTSIMHYLDLLYKFWPVFCIFSVVCLVVSRTYSLFFLFHQVFNILGLEGKYSNSEDQKSTDELLDLNKLNLKTGFRLKTVKAKKALHQWMELKDLELSELIKCGWFFNANQRNLKTPGKFKSLFLYSTLFLTAILFLSTSKLVSDPERALLKVNATGTWFWVGDYEAVSFRYDFLEWLRGDAWKLQQGDCRYEPDAKPLESSWDKDTICVLVLGMKDEYVKGAISSQRSLAAFFGIIGFLFIVFLFVVLYWHDSASKINALLENKLSTTKRISFEKYF
jgi:hypothetical protein